MSVARCQEINARLRAAGRVVHEWDGCWARGNGQTSAYEGGIVHHTASNYGSGYAALANGRPDLSGPLCNWSMNSDGSFTFFAAHPANHAGASGGRSMGPLPITSLFNKRVLGLEIVYPGVSPMTEGQHSGAVLWARVVADVVGGGDVERVRAHAETSITGKWDPGYAPGLTIDMNAFRSAARNASGSNPTEENRKHMLANEPVINPATGKSIAPFSDVIFYTNKYAGESATLIQAVNVKLDALSKSLSDDETNILAAIRGLGSGAVDVNALAEALVRALPPAATQDDVVAAVREAFQRAGSA